MIRSLILGFYCCFYHPLPAKVKQIKSEQNSCRTSLFTFNCYSMESTVAVRFHFSNVVDFWVNLQLLSVLFKGYIKSGLFQSCREKVLALL
jgi:hypothetical protein